jgi:hypothetical protein
MSCSMPSEVTVSELLGVHANLLLPFLPSERGACLVRGLSHLRCIGRHIHKTGDLRIIASLGDHCAAPGVTHKRSWDSALQLRGSLSPACAESLFDQLEPSANAP